jgi:RNA polymerase sigma-70 factor (ECF subfamily)
LTIPSEITILRNVVFYRDVTSLGVSMSSPAADDAALISQIAAGRSEALSELYDRYNRLVFSVALAVVGDRATAEEITLDAFVLVWQRADQYRPDRAKVSTWLTAITRHHAIDILRHQNSRLETKTDLWDDVAGDSRPGDGDPNIHALEDGVELAMQRERIQAAISQLPADQQEALALAFFGGYSHQQIADRLKQPLGTIKTRIRLAMQKLRHLLHEGEDPSANKSEQV